MNGTEEVASGLVVARGNSPELLEPGEEVLDQVASLVQVPVIFARLPARAQRRNHHHAAPARQRLDHPLVRIECLVGDESLGFNAGQQRVSALQIMGLPGREVKSRRIAQRIDRGVDLGAQPATAAPEGLRLGAPLFAPALCWWARTMVESIIAYSLSASAARCSNTRCHTPLLLQRENRV